MPVRLLQTRGFVLCRQDDSSFARKTIRHIHAGQFVICKQDDSSFPRRTIRLFHAGRFFISMQTGSSFPCKNNSYHHIIIPNILVAPGLGAFGSWALLAANFFALGRFVWPARARIPKNRRASRDFFAFCRAKRPARARFWVARALPGSIFGTETLRFSSFWGAPARSVLSSSEVYKTLAGATFFAHRSIRATRQKR